MNVSLPVYVYCTHTHVLCTKPSPSRCLTVYITLYEYMCSPITTFTFFIHFFLVLCSRDVVTAPTYQVPVPFAGESPYKQPLLFAARAGDASATGATSTDGGAAKMRGHAGGRAARKTSARPTSLTAKGRSLSLLAGPWTRKSSIEDQARELRQLPGPWARPSFIARQARALQFLRGPWSRPSTVAEMANKLKEQQGPWSRKASIGLQAHALGNLPGRFVD